MNAPDGAAALRQVREVITRLVRDGTAVARSDGTVHTLFPVAASAAEGDALQNWVTRVGASRTIEVGLGYGISALFVCEGLLRNGDPTARHVVLPRFLSEGRSFELAFVDGNHRFDGVFLDLVYLGRLVHPGGIVFVDDYQLAAVARAVSFCVTNLGWTSEEVSAGDDLHQWAVLRTSDVRDTRPFDYYVDF